jgi:putative DNA primase/helicase
MKRFTSSFPCLVCGGHDGLPKGHGRRCYGFLSGDGRFARCSREEHAGALQADPETGLFVHCLDGDCRCGARHGNKIAERSSVTDRTKEREAAIRKQQFALGIWGDSKPIHGTLVEFYLESRRIGLRPPKEELRFHAALRHEPTNKFLPAMVAPFRDANGNKIAIHRTYLKADGRGKADVPNDKMMLGPTKGAAIRFGDVGPEIRVAEGVENALTLREMLGFPAWAAGSATGVRQLDVPPVVRKLVIYADNDDGGKGVAAANDAARRFIREGRDARIVIPPPGTDVNDLLRDGAA